VVIRPSSRATVAPRRAPATAHSGVLKTLFKRLHIPSAWASEGHLRVRHPPPLLCVRGGRGKPSSLAIWPATYLYDDSEWPAEASWAIFQRCVPRAVASRNAPPLFHSSALPFFSHARTYAVLRTRRRLRVRAWGGGGGSCGISGSRGSWWWR
jgi:hypothetical protein